MEFATSNPANFDSDDTESDSGEQRPAVRQSAPEARGSAGVGGASGGAEAPAQTAAGDVTASGVATRERFEGATSQPIMSDSDSDEGDVAADEAARAVVERVQHEAAQHRLLEEPELTMEEELLMNLAAVMDEDRAAGFDSADEFFESVGGSTHAIGFNQDGGAQAAAFDEVSFPTALFGSELGWSQSAGAAAPSGPMAPPSTWGYAPPPMGYAAWGIPAPQFSAPVAAAPPVVTAPASRPRKPLVFNTNARPFDG